MPLSQKPEGALEPLTEEWLLVLVGLKKLSSVSQDAVCAWRLTVPTMGNQRVGSEGLPLLLSYYLTLWVDCFYLTACNSAACGSCSDGGRCLLGTHTFLWRLCLATWTCAASESRADCPEQSEERAQQ